MHSADSRLRLAAEWALRGLAIVLIGWAWLQSLGAVPVPRSERASSASLRAGLERWSTVAPPQAVAVTFQSSPGVVERDWLAALRRAGTEVRWTGTNLGPSAVAIASTADPVGGVDLAISAPFGSLTSLQDSLGVRDTVRAGHTPARLHLDRMEEGLAAVTGGVIAHDLPRDSLAFRRLLLLGRASWEARFVAAALTERGWVVDARYAVAPGSDVLLGLDRPRKAAMEAAPSPAPGTFRPRSTPGMPGDRSPMPGMQAGPAAAPTPPQRAEPRVPIAIDTLRYSAVLALDSTAARYGGEILRYVGSGGGLLLWPDAAMLSSFRSIAPGGASAVPGEPLLAIPDSFPRAALGLIPVAPLHPDAVVLEARGAVPAIAARRIDQGRVLQIGFQDTWRWPLGGGEGAPERYRAWLAGLVAQVAIVGRHAVDQVGSDPVPVAGLVDRLGPPMAPTATTREEDRGTSSWIFGVLTLALLFEWTSRRIRGAR